MWHRTDVHFLLDVVRNSDTPCIFAMQKFRYTLYFHSVEVQIRPVFSQCTLKYDDSVRAGRFGVRTTVGGAIFLHQSRPALVLI
jgi:hypothetical protein